MTWDLKIFSSIDKCLFFRWYAKKDPLKESPAAVVSIALIIGIFIEPILLNSE